MSDDPWVNPRGGLGTVMLYGAGPINEPFPTPQPIQPMVPMNPFQPGIQTPPPFDLTKVGAEDIGTILTRIRARIEVIKSELQRIEGLRDELKGLEAMLTVMSSPSPSEGEKK